MPALFFRQTETKGRSKGYPQIEYGEATHELSPHRFDL